ncbi:MAG TPA: Ig-like domain-containing protein, partial [Polyangiaceae bacterium]|nr:Ig-like domain-containing protein [Polyangiaceae bacterium]
MSKSGLGFRLSDAEPEPPPRAALAPAKTLSADDTAKLLARLPAFAKAAQPSAFALREKSLPPPRPGETIGTAFPPPVPSAGAPPVATSSVPPSLVRWAPEGAIEVAPNVSLTFSEPMVALSSHADADATTPPMRLVPQPPGRFRWVGTQTLLFEPDGERFPKATDYTVEVPAGTQTAARRPLREAKTFKFSLPPVKVESFHPDEGEPTKLDPMLVATFDQRIDRAAVLAHVRVDPVGPSGPVAMRLATDDEIEADEFARRALKRAEPGRFIAMKPVAALPKATTLKARFPPGLPSAEGPKLTTSEQAFPFETFGPLKLESFMCRWSETTCPPLSDWEVLFTNVIDAASFDRSLVTVAPPLAGMKVILTGRGIAIQGRSKGHTKYTVRIGAALRDEFGQTLAKDAEASLTVD